MEPGLRDSKPAITENYFIFNEDGTYYQTFKVTGTKSEMKGIYEIDDKGKITLTLPNAFPGQMSEFCNFNEIKNKISCVNWTDFIFIRE